MSDITVVSSDAKKLFRRLLEAREEVDTLEAQLKAAKENRDAIEQECHQALIESVGTSGQPVDLGPPFGKVRFNAATTTYGNILNEERLMDYLENSAQVEEYTRPALNRGELNTLARQLREQNASFPPGFDYREKKYVRVTVQK